MSKVVTMEQAVEMIKPNDFVITSGYLTSGTADAIMKAVAESFDKTGVPNNLSVMFAPSQGNKKGGQQDRWAKEGLLKTVIAGHYGYSPRIVDPVNRNLVKAYNLPQGVIVEMYRAIGQGRKGYITKIGLETFVDPRLEGGRLNSCTTEDIVKVIDIEGDEFLYYRLPKVNISLIRVTTADTKGNCTIEDEVLPLDMLSAAMAAKGCGGKVIVQAKNIVAADTIPSRQVSIPGIFVDAVVVPDNPEETHRQCAERYYDPALCGAEKVPVSDLAFEPFGTKSSLAEDAPWNLFQMPLLTLAVESRRRLQRLFLKKNCLIR